MEYQITKAKSKGFEDCYVDKRGVVYTSDGSIARCTVNHNGYYVFSHNGVMKVIHRIVAETFIHNYREGVATQVNHKDGNKKNNSVDNLEWVTPSENTKHAVDLLGVNYSSNNGNARAVKAIHKYSDNVLYFPTIADASRYFCGGDERTGQTVIWRVLNGMRKSAYDYYWYYDD